MIFDINAKRNNDEVEVCHRRMFARYENNLFQFYDFPENFNNRLRTVNLAEGLFSPLSERIPSGRELLRKYPGWTSADQVYLIMVIFLKGMKAYRKVFHPIDFLTSIRRTPLGKVPSCPFPKDPFGTGIYAY